MKSPCTTWARRRSHSREHAFARTGRAFARRAHVGRGSAIVVEERTQTGRRTQVPEQLPARRRVEERAERQAQAGVHHGDAAHLDVVELRPGLAAVPLLEQAHLMAVERGPPCERPGDREVRIDRRHVCDRCLLQVEHRLVLAAVRDLEHTAGAPVVEQKRLVTLAAELRRSAVDAEELGCDCAASWAVNRGGVDSRTEVTAADAIRPGVQNPSSERIGSPFCGTSPLGWRPTLRPLIGGYCGSFCGTGRTRQGG